MKRTVFYMIAILLFSGKAFTQPTITATNHLPAAGDWYRLSTNEEFSGVPTGASGESQNWDYSQYAVSTNITVTATKPENTPYYDPGNPADLALVSGNSSYQYLKIENNAYYWNMAVINNNTINYNDPIMVLKLPFTFGDAIEDRYEYLIEEGGMTQHLFGNITITADAWGNITTPVGTFENTLRVKRTLLDTIVTIYGDYTNTFADTICEYLWYAEGLFYPVYTLTELASMPGSATIRYLIDYQSTGINKIVAGKDKISIFPNPATSEITIKTNIPIREITLSDISGKILLKNNVRSTSVLQTSFDVSGFTEGIYFIRIEEITGEKTYKKLIVRN